MSQSGPSINTTPLIDVLLVLLVLLVITLPRSTHRISLDLPVHGSSNSAQRTDVDIDFDGRVFWNGSPVADDLLLERRFAEAAIAGTLIRVLPDRLVRYERVAQVLASAQRARVTHLAVAEISD
jgi:biopolymer transport protein ExbD